MQPGVIKFVQDAWYIRRAVLTGRGADGETLWRYHLCLDLTPLSSISVDQQIHQQRSL
jgi:hypothetical protein